jgi:type II secretory pathway component PulF
LVLGQADPALKHEGSRAGRLLIAAERGGDLDSAFDALAEDMASDVEQRSARLLALLEPAVIVAMFAVLAPLVVAVAVPMMTTPTDF